VRWDKGAGGGGRAAGQRSKLLLAARWRQDLRRARKVGLGLGDERLLFR
jgi:hypothetical protein